jgi:CRISPR-associated protein (TIGR03986 family)
MGNHKNSQPSRKTQNQASLKLPEKLSPYTFVPVVFNQDQQGSLVDVVWHDGSSEKSTLSGELCCTLTALTPLFVGHYQYPVSSKNDVRIIDKDRDGPKTVSLNSDSWGQIVKENRFNAKKSFIEPLFWRKEEEISGSPILIPGTSLKGMVRHNIGALLSAPMEKVKEQYFSYRPNLGWNNSPSLYQCREAIIEMIDHTSKGKLEALEVTLLPFGRHAFFISEREIKNFSILRTASSGDTIFVTPNSIPCGTGNKKNRIDSKFPSFLDSGEYVFLKYRAGIDGDGQVSTTHKKNDEENHKKKDTKKGSRKDDVAVLVSKISYDSGIKVKITSDIVSQFRTTKDELSDEVNGHISRNESAKDFLRGIKNSNLEVNQLIYVEIEKLTNRVVSFGHNYRYRWHYADSVKMILEGSKGKRIKRPEVDFLKGEEVDGSDKSQLTVVRQLLGYTSEEMDKQAEKNDETSEEDSQAKNDETSGQDSLKKAGDYVNMAGRISINSAIEQGDLNNLNQRFVKRSKDNNIDSLHRFTIPLKTLGQPRASAVEHYLQQDDKYLKTYGDLPGVEPSGTSLNGRKFYRHQPMKGNETFEETDAVKIMSNHSSFAQFISQPGTQFLFKVRFRDLRSWELGALMLALNPRLGRAGTANKLGHGRPLGLGSVNIDIDKINFLELDGTLTKDQQEKDNADYIKDLKAHSAVSSEQLERWLDALQFEGTGPAAYPNAEHNIYTYHSNIRALYSVLRRDGAPMPENFGEPVKTKQSS